MMRPMTKEPSPPGVPPTSLKRRSVMDSRLPFLVCVLLACCGPAPKPAPQQAQIDPTTERWYGQTVNQLVEMNRQAKDYFQKGKSDEAAALIQKGEPLSNRLLSVHAPTLAATEAAS